MKYNKVLIPPMNIGSTIDQDDWDNIFKPKEEEENSNDKETELQSPGEHIS